MARQRFIWPEMWSDPDLASLPPGAHLLYIACFSLADDEGRLDGSSAFLRSHCFTYRTVSLSQLTRWKKQVAEVCKDFCLYEHNGREYIAFRNWGKYQKPKYPSPSKLPKPPWDSGNESGNDSVNASGNDSSTGWVGLGSTPLPPSGTHPTGAGRGNTKTRSTKASRRTQALAAVTKIAKTWSATDSAAFAERLDELEHEHGITFRALEREALWDTARQAITNGHQQPLPAAATETNT